MKNEKQRKNGGLYGGVNISARAADALTLISCGALALCLFAAIAFAA